MISALGPFDRNRRMRNDPRLREMVKEHTLKSTDFVLPVFVEECVDSCSEIETLPGACRVPESQLVAKVQELEELGVPAILLFGVSHNKDHIGSDTWADNGLLSRMIKTAKSASPRMVVIADLCICEYTDHGHCGPIVDGRIDNDTAIENLGKQAIAAANAGVDVVAPSSMMDGQVFAIRKALDSSGYAELPIFAYSAKFASSFYDPFRSAAGTNLGGDRSNHMIDYRNGRDAIRESLSDVSEGADALIVKPGIHYLDVIAKLRPNTTLPICAYHTSGEFAMLSLAANARVIDGDKAVLETMYAFKRAGADVIISYATLHVLRLLRGI